MEESTGTSRTADVRSILLDQLYQEQKYYSEGSLEFSNLQSKINQIIAENYLEYLNRL